MFGYAATAATVMPCRPSWPHDDAAAGRAMVAREDGGGYATAGGQGRVVRAVGAGSTTGRTVALGEVEARVAGVAAALSEMAGGELEVGSVEALDGCLAALRRLDGAVAAVKARVIGCAQRSGVHARAGMADGPAYVRDRLGVSAGEAKRQWERARDLEGMDRLTDALASGGVGPEQAAVVGRAARHGRLGDREQTEQQLLEAARTATPEQLAGHVRGREAAADADATRRDENRLYAQRRLSMRRRHDGGWVLSGLLDPASGSRVWAALGAHSAPDPASSPLAARRRPEQRLADALIETADTALRSGTSVVGGVRPHVSLVVPIEALDPDAAVLATSEHGTVHSAETARRLLCDATLRRVVLRGRCEVLDIGRATPVWNVGQRRAVVVRDGGCRGPGCDRPPAWCDVHHVRWWSKGGTTSIDNGLLLCRRHHRLLHEGGWDLTHDPVTGRADFHDPTGTRTTTTWPHPRPTTQASGHPPTPGDPPEPGGPPTTGNPPEPDHPPGPADRPPQATDHPPGPGDPPPEATDHPPSTGVTPAEPARHPPTSGGPPWRPAADHGGHVGDRPPVQPTLIPDG